METPLPPVVAATPRSHNPLRITILNPQLTFSPGDTISGHVTVSLQRELIDSMDVVLTGTSETDFGSDKGSSSPPILRTSVVNKNMLVDVVKRLIQSPTNQANGTWPFQFIIPEFTDTVGKYGSSRTSLKFAIQRHRLPPTFEQYDADGNMVRIKYGILARMSRASRDLPPYKEEHELIMDISKEQQEVPSADGQELKTVIRRLHRPTRSLRSCVSSEKLRKLLLRDCTPIGPHLRLTPTIFVPDLIIPGRQLPVTILFTPKPKHPADPDKSRIELLNLRICLKEETSILARNDRFARLRICLGPINQPKNLRERKFPMEDQRIETSKPYLLEQDGTQSLFKRVYKVDETVSPNIKTFNISKTHTVSVQAEFKCEGYTFNLNYTTPVTVVQKRMIDLDLLLSHSVDTYPGTPGAASCSACRHALALSAARELLAPGRLPAALEFSNESSVTNTMPSTMPPTRPSQMRFPPRAHLHLPWEHSGEQQLEPIEERSAGTPVPVRSPTDSWVRPPRRGYVSVG